MIEWFGRRYAGLWDGEGRARARGRGENEEEMKGDEMEEMKRS